jgi:hypothetical protein
MPKHEGKRLLDLTQPEMDRFVFNCWRLYGEATLGIIIATFTREILEMCETPRILEMDSENE